MKKIFASLTALVLSLSLFACNAEKPSNDKAEVISDKKLKVMASFFVPADFAKKIGGDLVEVKTLISPSVEPHDYEPSIQDMVQINESDIFIYNGAGMESWLDAVKESVDNKNIVYVDTSEGIELLKTNHSHHHEHHDGDKHEDEHHEHHDGDKHEDEHHEHHDGDKHEDEHHEHLVNDPHIWLSPLNAKQQLLNIKNAFVAKDPAHASVYEANYAKYAEEMDNLHKEYAEKISKLSNKNMIVSHEAFGYLCKEYGLIQKGIRGLNADDEPSAAALADLVEYAKEHKVSCIFFEELVSPKVAETLAKELNIKTASLNPLEGGSDSENEDYISIMRHNLQIIIENMS